MLSVEKRYHLPVQAMLLVMASSVDRVLLQTHLPGLPGISQQVCLVQMLLEQGGVRSCTITSKTGAILRQQQEAVQVLERCGDLDWHVTTLVPTPQGANHSHTGSLFGAPGAVASTGRTGAASPIPRLRVHPVPPDILASLSRSHRMALVLVDGKRSVNDIAHLLAKSSSDVQEIFAVLRHLVQL